MQKNKWMERNKDKYKDIENWKQSEGLYIIDFINSKVESEIYYNQLRKLFSVSTWEEAFDFYDKEVLEQTILLAFQEDSIDKVTYEYLIQTYDPQYIYCRFLEYYLDNLPSQITGLLTLFVLDKLKLLKEDIDLQYL